MAKHNLSLPNQAAITKQSIAGVVSTATHGSGKTGTFASFITSVKLVTADGSILTISSNENRDLFPAARTNVGTLGIVVEYTLQCVPLFNLERITRMSNWDTVMKNYEKLLNENDFMQFYWFVDDDSVEITINNRSATKPEKKPLQKTDPEDPTLSYNVLAGTLETLYMEEEIAVPRDKFVKAAQAVRELMQKERKKNSRFNGITFRFVAAEKDNILSTAADRDVVFISITTNVLHGYEDFYKEFYNLMLKFDGRPHWGKINYLNQNDTKKLYGKNYDEFILIRKKLDPDGLFSNEFTKRVFGR